MRPPRQAGARGLLCRPPAGRAAPCTCGLPAEAAYEHFALLLGHPGGALCAYAARRPRARASRAPRSSRPPALLPTAWCAVSLHGRSSREGQGLRKRCGASPRRWLHNGGGRRSPRHRRRRPALAGGSDGAYGARMPPPGSIGHQRRPRPAQSAARDVQSGWRPANPSAPSGFGCCTRAEAAAHARGGCKPGNEARPPQSHLGSAADLAYQLYSTARRNCAGTGRRGHSLWRAAWARPRRRTGCSRLPGRRSALHRCQATWVSACSSPQAPLGHASCAPPFWAPGSRPPLVLGA